MIGLSFPMIDPTNNVGEGKDRIGTPSLCDRPSTHSRPKTVRGPKA